MEHHSHESGGSCCAVQKRTDWILWGTAIILGVTYVSAFVAPDIVYSLRYVGEFAASVVELLHKMWWGILLGIFSVGVIGTLPRELIMSLLGKGGTLNGIVRATLAGVLLDLCSHGILLVGMKLYKRGASLGQTMAFLIASPWNSLSLTLILWSLVGFTWMISFLLLSLCIAIISGFIFDKLVHAGTLDKNPHEFDLPEDYSWKEGLMEHVRKINFSPASWWHVFLTGLSDSKMILRWIFFGTVLAAFIRATVPIHLFETAFGPSIVGLLGTLVFATILEVCSEGSLPVATDILLRAKAAGNSFAFLMTGVSTDYTEMLAIKETTKSWKTAFFLPLVTLPQVIFLAILLNGISV